MKRLLGLFFAFALLFPTIQLKAQNFEKGAAVFSVGYGFANLSKGVFNTVVDGFNDSLGTDISRRSLGPLYLKAEYGLGENFGMGLNIAYIGMNASWDDLTTNYNYKVARNNVSFLLRFNRYWVNSNNFDLYTGIGIGYRTGGWKLTSNDPTFVDLPAGAVPFGFEATLGFRGYITDNIAAYGELGISKGLAQIGISYKL